MNISISIGDSTGEPSKPQRKHREPGNTGEVYSRYKYWT